MMPLPSGTRLGPYEILSAIGAGGMGEVYRGRDTRLDRMVAIKVLSARLRDRPELRQRFEREARAISSLNHPHITALYDIGSQDDIDFIVMELLDGATLAAHVAKGPIPLEAALRYGIQVADALDKAHHQGIVHRDLKPENVMLARSGAKLLDFGLAKLRAPPPLAPAEGAGTESMHLTKEGVVLGTFQYMAPEQLGGKEADVRTDIFAFGALLYEMITGRKAFPGTTAASIIAAIMHSDPPLVSTLQTLAPPGLDILIRTCLQKEPEDRWQTIHDVKVQLEWIAGSALGDKSDPGRAPLPSRRDRPRLRTILFAALTLLAGGLLGAAFMYMRMQPARPDPLRLFVLPPDNAGFIGSIALSPDGKQLAFAASSADGSASLWLRALNSWTLRALPGTAGALHPFWSPDGHFVAFFADGKLKKIRVEGGPPQVLCDVFDARGGSWSRNGTILFSRNVGDRLYRIPDSGGTSEPVTVLSAPRKETSHEWPYFLADGQHFLYLALTAQSSDHGVYAGSLGGGEPARILNADSGVAYLPQSGSSGRLLYMRSGTLLAQEFSARSLRLSGEAFPVAEGLWYDATRPGLTAFTAGAQGVLAYRTGGVRNTQLVWIERKGTALKIASAPGAYRDPWLSPDEKKIVVSHLDAQSSAYDVWLLEPARSLTSRFTFSPFDETTPIWSPDSAAIVFTSNRGGAPDLYRKSSTGGGEEELLLKSDRSKYTTDWSHDGRLLLYATWDPRTKWDIWVLPLRPVVPGGQAAPMPYLQTDFETFQAQFSPDGKWIAYTSNESNRYEIYVQSFPISARKWQISTNGGAQPRWRRDGRELFYISYDRKLMSVDVKPGPNFEPGAPRPLFQTQVTGLVDARNHYVASADGQRFLVNSVVGEVPSAPIQVITQWSPAVETK